MKISDGGLRALRPVVTAALARCGVHLPPGRTDLQVTGPWRPWGVTTPGGMHRSSAVTEIDRGQRNRWRTQAR